MKLKSFFGKPFMKKFPSQVIVESCFRLSVSGSGVVVVVVVVDIVVFFSWKILIGLPFDKKLMGLL